MKHSRDRSPSPLAIVAGLALAAYGFSKLTRNSRFFAGKVVVITGGSRGLGLVIARKLYAEGATVVLLARDAEELDRAAGEFDAARGSGHVFTHVCDVTQPEQIEAAVAAIGRRFGRIDALFNVAGMISVGPLAHMELDDFEALMRLHFGGALRMIWATLPYLRKSEGARIVNISSIGGKIAVPHLAAYSASKFALVGLSDALRSELAQEGIKVTTVCPGLMRTGSHINAMFKGQRDKEFDWFSTSNNLPLDSVSAESAARKIVEAARWGQPSLTFPLSVRAAVIGAAVFPNLTAHVLAFVNRFVLPAPAAARSAVANTNLPGRDSRSMETTPAWKTPLIDRAAERNNEA